MSLLKAFTTQISNLIIELSEVLPYNKDVYVNQTAIELLIKTNPRLVLTAFDNYITPFKEQILGRDDKFFLSSEINENDLINKQLIATFNILREYWVTLSNKTKDTIWLYFHVLIKLSEKLSKTI